MVGQQVVRLTHDPKRGFTGRELLATDLGRIRDIKQGLDGYIYLVTDDRDGKPTPVLRLEPVERQTNK
jgi:glucose/arabinose dehydrogenase